MITFRNDSEEAITAFVLSIGELKITYELAYTGQSILPGQSRTEEMYDGNFTAAAVQNPEQAGVLDIVAVYFVNRGDGDPYFVQTIGERHKGMKDQLTLAVPLLRTTVSTLQPEESSIPVEALEALSSRLKADASKPPASRDYDEGRAWITRLLDNDITEAKIGRGLTPGAVSKKSFNRLVLLCEKIQSQL
jgi:hypothetical protein